MRRFKQATHLAIVLSILSGAIVPTKSDAVEPAADSRVIVARVVDDAGKTQSDVAVSLFDYDEDWRYWRKLERDARTDATGVAKFDGLAKDQSYAVRAKTSDDRVGYREYVLTGDEQRHEAGVNVQRPIPTSVRVQDESGQPVSGAQFFRGEHTGSNGSFGLDWQTFASYDLTVGPSNRDGVLTLPPLPPGTLDLRVIHPNYAPCAVKNIRVGDDDVVATLRDGVKVTLRIETGGSEPPIDSVVIDFRSTFDNASTLIGRLPMPLADGIVRLTVAPGEYQWLRLTHPDFAVTPIYCQLFGRGPADKLEPFGLRPHDNEFTFRLKRKVKVRGRVLDEKAGQPVAGEFVEGELHAINVESPFARFAREWTHAGWGETNERGEYELDLAAGHARVSFLGQGKIAKIQYQELDVAPNGSTQVADILVSPMPKVRGLVYDQNGRPVPDVVVRFRGSTLTFEDPVITVDKGRFELAPSRIPEDWRTHERQPVQTIVAFHPTERIYAQTEVRLDDPDSLNDIRLRLEPENFESLITRFPGDLSPWQRGEMPEERRKELGAISLVGKPAPELDGAHWLNTESRLMSLADFRGKYVLLQFWTTWCGPCHADMASLRLLHDLYRDTSLVIIGIHDNSMPLAAIEADVAKERLKYPIVVDHPDGRILASYEAHGVSGYPSYMLIGPDGIVLIDDETVPGPTLRSFKLEIVRELLLSERSATSSNK